MTAASYEYIQDDVWRCMKMNITSQGFSECNPLLGWKVHSLNPIKVKIFRKNFQKTPMMSIFSLAGSASDVISWIGYPIWTLCTLLITWQFKTRYASAHLHLKHIIPWHVAFVDIVYTLTKPPTAFSLSTIYFQLWGAFSGESSNNSIVSPIYRIFLLASLQFVSYNPRMLILQILFPLPLVPSPNSNIVF